MSKKILSKFCLDHDEGYSIDRHIDIKAAKMNFSKLLKLFSEVFSKSI